MDSTDFSFLTIAFVIAYVFSLIFSSIYNGTINPAHQDLLRYGLLCIAVGFATTAVVKAALERK